MIQFTALVKKEFREAIRDHRALMMAMMMAALAPVMLFGLSKMVIKEMSSKPPVYVQVIGAEFAPKLIEQLATDNIFPMSDVPEDEANLWQTRNLQLTIPESFASDMQQGIAIDLIIRADYSEKSHKSLLRRIKESIQRYGQVIGYQRLLMRGIDLQILSPVKVIEQDTALPSSNFAFVTAVLGLYLLMAAFMSGLSVAIDSSAGERERNVLEILLCQPISTMKIVLAKLSAASAVAVLGVVLTLVLTSVSMGFVDLSQIGATFELSASTVIALLAMLLPICLFASALQLFVSFRAKSFKEAQSTVSMIIMVPAMLPFALMFIDDKPKWLEWMPVSGQTLLMEDLFKGIPIDWNLVALTGGITLAITAGLVVSLAKSLTSEKVVLTLS